MSDMKIIKVALIEDDKDIVQMYVMRFKMYSDFDIQFANDGAAGLKLIDSFKPDIILLDMMMPTMSGVETLTRLRALPNGQSCKVIALTNMNDDDTLAKIHTLGVEDYIVKANSSPGKIVDKVRSILGRPEPATTV